MKKKKCWFVLLPLAIMTSFILSCSSDDDSEDNKYAEFSALFSTTDKIINELPYSGSGGVKSSTTSDYKYMVTLLGRIITVKKNNSSSTPSYYTIKEALLYRYKSNKKVSDVFLNNAGTITIDCRSK